MDASKWFLHQVVKCWQFQALHPLKNAGYLLSSKQFGRFYKGIILSNEHKLFLPLTSIIIFVRNCYIIYGNRNFTLIAENIGGTWYISPQKDAAAFFISSSLMCSQGSRWITWIKESTIFTCPCVQRIINSSNQDPKKLSKEDTIDFLENKQTGESASQVEVASPSRNIPLYPFIMPWYLQKVK